MDQAITLDRSAPAPETCFAPLAKREFLATKGLMLHQLCALAHNMRTVAVREILSEQDLDLRDWIALSTLCELGSGTQRDIVKATSLDKVAVNRAVSRLKDKGLVISEPHSSDGRSHVLELTDLGTAIVLDSSNELLAFERSLLESFSEQERGELRRLLGGLTKSIEAIYGA